VGRGLEAAERVEREASQSTLFGEAEASRAAQVALVETPAWDLKRQLTEEKVALGFCLSGHLFSVYERELAGFPRVPLAKLAAAGERVWMAGIVAAARVQTTRRGRMMVVGLEDGTAQVEISVFNELLERHRGLLREGALLIVHGRAQRDEFAGGLRVVAEDLLDLAAARGRFAARLQIAMNGQSEAKRLMQTLEPYREAGEGGCPVMVHYESGSASCDVALGDTWRVRPDERLIGELSAWLAPENVQVVFRNGPPRS
jgi:DNA polymerase-3 subunit alpha